jgi:hypothetical protein
MRPSSLAPLAFASLLLGCGARSASPAPAATCPSAPPPLASTGAAKAPSGDAPTPAEPPPPSLPPPALVAALDAALEALIRVDYAVADKQLATADTVAGSDAHLAYLVARVRATRFAQADDFDRAAAAFVAVIPALAKLPALPDEFWAHNAMMMIREAQGDPASALAENDQATLSAARGTWDPARRDTLAFQKDRWHRAYLTRMLAESRSGAAKEALVQYANAALADYRSKGFDDSVAVLDAYFAALDGRRDAALAAARRVDPEQDDDVEDLYLVVVGLEAGGDHAGAEVVRKAMRAPSGPRISQAIMLRWLELDAKWPKGGGFTPWHAAGH